MTAECTNLDHSDYKVACNHWGLERIERRYDCKVCGRPEFGEWFRNLYWHQTNAQYWKGIFKDAEEQRVFYFKAEPRGQRSQHFVFVDPDVNDPTSILIPTRPDWAQGDLTVVIKQERYRRRMKPPQANDYGELQLYLTRELEQIIKTNDLDYVDNFRFADVKIRKDVRRFRKQAETGCCGSFETEVTVGGRRFLVGCNYGH
jgi:hypothetical protein